MAQLFSIPGMPAIGGSLLEMGAPQRRRKREDEFVLSPEEESSIIKSTLRGGLSGLAFVGNVLDTPGSIVRNSLVGRNPFQGFLSPENRTTGRELLEKAGMLRKNKPGFDWGDVAGVAAEIATDPLLFTGAFGAGLSKSGKAAKALGILGEAPKVASAQLGRQVGKRAGRMNLTLNELVQGLDPAARQAAQEGLQRMAQTKGQAGAAWLQDVGNQRLGGLFEAGIPFGPRAAIGGPGGVAESIAGKLDTAGNALRWSYPGRQAARILNPQVFGTNTAVVQREAPGLFKAQTESRIASNKFTEEVIDFRARHNLGDDAEDMLRELYESKTHNAPGVASRISQQFNVPQQELLQLRRYHRAKLISILREGREWGVKGSRYSDPEINYFPRSLAFTSKSGTIFGAEESASRLVPGGQRALTAAHEHSIHRKEFLSGIRGGTDTIKRIAKDPDLLLLMDQQGGTTQDIANFIKQRYGAAGLDLVPEKYTHRGAGGAMVDRNRYKAMANWLSRFDKETRAAGIYGNGTVYEMARRLDHHGDAIGAVKTVLNVLQDPSVWRPTTTAARHPESRTLLKTLNKLGIEPGNETRGFLRKLAEAEGLPVTPQTIADLGKRHLDVNVARDLAYVMKPFNSPTELKGFMMAVDSMSNYFKAMVTGPWVAFANRNFGSGQFRNWTAEMFSPWSVKAVWDTIRGNPLSGKAFDRIAAIPLVREEAQRLGVQLTPDTAREIVSRLGRRYSLIGRYQGEIAQRTGPAGQALSTAFADEVAGFPGGLGPMKRPASFKRILRKYAGRDPNVTWSLNPLKGRIRGVLGSPETTFAPVAAGEDLNFVVESMNRLAPWLHELAKGTDPLVAKLKVGAAQVEYGSRNFTPFERQWMTRLFPFYKFQCVPTSHEILTRKGWKTHDQLEIGEEVLAYDCKKNTLHWTPLRNIHRHNFEGQLLSYKTRNVHFLFTENHRWPVTESSGDAKWTRKDGTLVVRKRKRTVKMVYGCRLRPGHKIPCAGQFRGRSSVLPPRLAAILGWVVTDGYFRWRTTGDKKTDGSCGSCEMLVYQSPGKYLAELIELLGTTPRNPHPVTGCVAVPVSRKDTDELTKIFKSKKDLLWIIPRLSRESADAMWTAMFHAEGNTSPKGQQRFYQSRTHNPEVLEAFQVLCLLTGRSANIAKAHQGCYIKTCKHYWTQSHPQKVAYKGLVWCPETDYGTWVMRHDGAVIITGNSRQIPYVIRELWERPGGKTGQAIRAATAARDPGLATPEYVSESTSIPLPGGPAEGHQRFLTGLGLMHEDPLRMMAPSIQQSGQELLGRLSPMIKAPMEMVLGRSFFQKGRALEDMDPLVGRIAANVAGAAKLEPASVAAEREAFRMPVVAETAISNSPFARALTTARQLTDPRKRATAFGLEGKYPIPGLAALAQLATGVRVTDVSPAAQDAILRDELSKVIKKTPGSSVFERAGFSKDELAKMPEAERTKALQLQAVMNMLAAKAKERKKAREQAAAERQAMALGGW